MGWKGIEWWEKRFASLGSVSKILKDDVGVNGGHRCKWFENVLKYFKMLNIKYQDDSSVAHLNFSCTKFNILD